MFAFLFLISGCFETGENQGSNKVLLNGSVLKGRIIKSNVSLFDVQGNLIWEGTTNEKGEFTAEFPSKSNKIYIVVATVANGAMQCDATECIAPLSSTIYQFGDFIPGNEIGNIAFKSAIYVNDQNKYSDEDIKSIQINSLSTLVVDMVDVQLDKGLSYEQFRSIANSSSAILVATLGLGVGETETINVLEITLPDIVQQDSINSAEPLTESLGLINASQAKDIGRLERFSDALVQYSLSPEDESVITELEEFQQTILQETYDLITSDLLQVDNEEVLKNLTEALNNGVNYTELLAAGKQFAVATGKIHDAILASSTYWGANINPVVGQWWWVSGSYLQPKLQKSEWVQLNYTSSFLARQIKIGIDNKFQSEYAIIQGSNDDANWVELADLNALDNPEYHIDERNVKHISIVLNQMEHYKQYRFYAETTNPVWLEYLCVYQSDPVPTTDQACENDNALSNIPSKIITSSSMLAPINIDNKEPKSWWLSELGSGNEEWLQISYQIPFVADRVEIVVKQSSQGETPTIQGSFNGNNWTVITSISPNKYSDEWIDDQGFRHFEISLNNLQGFQYYRYHSKPTSFVWLRYLRFSAQQ